MERNHSRWIVSTDRGDSIRARFVIIPSGPMDRPKLPGIPGIERFPGHSFHTSRWDYEYTGGDAVGGMFNLADKSIAIIGTGATAIQCIPHLADSARHLYVLQRTPSSVDVKNDGPLDPKWLAGLTPGWQQRLMENLLSLNFQHMIGEQTTHVAHIIGRLPREGIAAAEVTRAAEADWVGEIERSAISQAEFLRECTPSYFNAEGDLTRLNRLNSPFGGGPLVFYKIIKNWRARGDMPGFELKHDDDARPGGNRPAPDG